MRVSKEIVRRVAASQMGCYVDLPKRGNHDEESPRNSHVRSGGAVLRSGAKPGDSIYVTGTLGGSLLGLERLKAGHATDPAVQRHLYPQPRQRVGAAIDAQAHAMIDVSDGLSTDFGHILDESRVSARIYKDRIPMAQGAGDAHALHGGEEYELIIVGLELPSAGESIPLTRIGEIIDSPLDPQRSPKTGQ